MKGNLEKVLELINNPGLDVKIIKKRCTLPEANYYPKMGQIVIRANKPALERFALLHLILHELSHDEYIKACERVGRGEADDHHLDPLFIGIERENLGLVDDLMELEHDGEFREK